MQRKVLLGTSSHWLNNSGPNLAATLAKLLASCRSYYMKMTRIQICCT